ncbi:MAG: hypothetical protein ACFFCM_19010 [Promethearchaeota archaeon]
MIHKLYLMFAGGICVFEKKFYTHLRKEEEDTQIFTGFISAIGNFASEALGSTLQSIHLQTGEQLAIMKHDTSNLYVVCIADGRDHEKLLAKILLKILDRFYGTFKKEIESEDTSLIDKTINFDNEIEIILNKKVTRRTNWKLLLGIILGLGIMTLLIFTALNRMFLHNFPGPLLFAAISNPLMPIFIGSLGESIGYILASLMFFVGILFILPAFVAGYLSGTRVRGLISGLIIITITYLMLILGALRLTNVLWLDLKGWFLGISPLIFFLTLSVAFVAGYFTERLRLHTFKEPTLKKGRLSKLLIFKRKK